MPPPLVCKFVTAVEKISAFADECLSGARGAFMRRC